jgi:hypothetical protein
MAAEQMVESILAAAALASVILLLGAVFLLILRTPKFQFSLRFLLITIGCIAVSLGLWTAVLRGVRGPGLTGPGIDVDTTSPIAPAPTSPIHPGLETWSEPMDGPYEPKPLTPAGETPNKVPNESLP